MFGIVNVQCQMFWLDKDCSYTESFDKKLGLMDIWLFIGPLLIQITRKMSIEQFNATTDQE